MVETKSIQEQHTAGPIAIAFDYQFYYFMFLALGLKNGQKIGFEIKDDVHIDKEDGTTILYQTKHTIDTLQNLSSLDTDLWKTLSNWSDFINVDKSNSDFLKKHSFVLVTNKSENNNNFINSLNQFKTDDDIDKVLNKINELANKTQNETLKKYIKNVGSLGKRKLKLFLLKLVIETNVDDIIKKVKNRILDKCLQDKFVEPIFEKLSSNLQETKYTDIKDRKKFEVSYDDFKNKFGRCFQIAFEAKPLPKREFPVLLPENLESQTFIKQLLDIGEVQHGSNEVRNYTTQMLKFINNLEFWLGTENSECFLLPTEIAEFEMNSVLIWANEFKAKYRKIENQVSSGISISDLEDDIKSLGIELVEYLRKQDLQLQGYSALGIEFSNGHYYALSDSLKIGWHFDWKNKYIKA